MNQTSHWVEQFVEKSILAICLTVGLLGVVASKAITVLVILCGAGGLAAILLTGKKRPRALSAITVSLIVLFVWSALSSFWALNQWGAFSLSVRLATLCLAGFVLVHFGSTISNETRDTAQKTLLGGYAIGLLAIGTGFFYAKVSGDSLWGSYYFDPLTTLNNGAVIMALLLFPTAFVAWHRFNPIAAVMLIGAVSSGLFFLSSGASLMSIAVGVCVFTLVFKLGRTAVLALAVIVAGLLLTAPFVTDSLTSSRSIHKLVERAPASVIHRQKMWDFATHKIQEDPFFGKGMDSSRHISQDDYRLAPNMEIMPLHPHNAALQIRLELGLPGTIIAAALVFLLFNSALTPGLSREQMALRTSLLSAYLSVGAVSYGVWQTWWIATAWIMVVIIENATPKILHESRSQEKMAK